MEEVLDVYTQPHDPEMPLVCLDECSKQLVSETRTPIPMKPGQPERVDYEYERNGTANLFMLFAPLEGWRHVEVTDRRTAVDYAHSPQRLIGRPLPGRQEDQVWSKTISTHMSKPRFTRHSRPPKPGGSWSASNGTTRPSTAAG